MACIFDLTVTGFLRVSRQAPRLAAVWESYCYPLDISENNAIFSVFEHVFLFNFNKIKLKVNDLFKVTSISSTM